MADNAFEAIAAAGVRSLKPYQPGKPIEELERQYGVSNIIKLASNENPLGPSPQALEAIRRHGADLALYPDPNGFALKAALAARHGVDPSQITLGNGSNDVLVLLAEAFLTSADAAMYSQYSFAVYPIATQAAGARHQVVPALAPDSAMALGHDLEAMSAAIDETTRLIFIANPNNPTGTWVEPEVMQVFLARVPDNVIVAVDEAYVEYGAPDTPTADQWLERFPNLVVTRTFSKAYGLAGLRVGYAISHPDVADLLNRIRQPFNVNTLALAAAEAALTDHAFIQQSRTMNQQGLAQLKRGFDALGLAHVPTRGNFILVNVGRPGRAVFEDLLRQAVIVRPVDNYGLSDYLRITVGTEAQNETVLAALSRALG